jgi:hypothetical protein
MKYMQVSEVIGNKYEWKMEKSWKYGWMEIWQ